jgi:hypothetical protein
MLKPVSTETTTDATSYSDNAVTLEKRRYMIAEAAYYRAEHWGFKEGSPEQDWLEAEKEIDEVFHVIY